MASTSSGTIIDRAWELLRVDGSTTDVPGLQEVSMLAILNIANKEWNRAFRRGSGEPQSTIQSETGYDLIVSTALAANITTSSSSITVDDSSDAQSSGAFVIYDDSPDIGEYTGNSSNTLTGVSGLGFAHEDGDEVSFLYALPTNFQNFRTDAGAPDGVLVSGKPYFYTTGEPLPGYFSLYDNGTTKYLWFPKGLTGQVSVSYNKSGDTLDDTSDLVTWIPDYDFFGIYRLVEHGHRARGDDPMFAKEARSVADRTLREALQEQNIGHFVRVRPIRSYTPRYSDTSLTYQTPR